MGGRPDIPTERGSQRPAGAADIARPLVPSARQGGRPSDGRNAGAPSNRTGRGLPSSTVRVLVADDQPLMRRGVSQFLSQQPGLSVVGEAADGREVLALARALRPHVVVLDDRLRHLDATTLFDGLGPHPPRVVVYAGSPEDMRTHALLAAGAASVVAKEAPEAALREAVLGAAAPAAGSGRGTKHRPGPGERGLSMREHDVARLVAAGCTDAEIASLLRVAESTVGTHLRRIFRKLAIHSRVELALWFALTRA